MAGKRRKPINLTPPSYFRGRDPISIKDVSSSIANDRGKMFNEASLIAEMEDNLKPKKDTHTVAADDATDGHPTK